MELPSCPRVAGLVLAAGRSLRMGRPKLLLPLGGEPLLAPVLRTALALGTENSPLLEPVAAVVGPAAPGPLRAFLAAHDRLLVTEAHDADLGQAHSLRAGLAAVLEASRVPPDGVCVFLGDMPLVDVAILRMLLAAFGARPAAFALPVCRGRRGNPVIIPRHMFELTARLQGDTGARPLLDDAEAGINAVAVEDVAVLLDADTPRAYAALRREWLRRLYRATDEGQRTSSPPSAAVARRGMPRFSKA